MQRRQLLLLLAMAVLLAGRGAAAGRGMLQGQAGIAAGAGAGVGARPEGIKGQLRAGQPLAIIVCRGMTPRQRAEVAAADRQVAAGLAEVQRRRVAALARGVPATTWMRPRPPEQEGPAGGSVGVAVSRGRAAPSGKMGYMVSLWHKDFREEDGTMHYCGGTLIRPSVVLTAAHCVFSLKSYKKFFWPEQVKVGGLHLHYDDTRAFFHYYETRFAVRVMMHPLYDPDEYPGDLALIQLNRPVNTTTLRPTKLAPANLKLRHGQMLFTAGWGATTESNSGSETLLYTQVPFVDRPVCLRRQGDYPLGHICAGGSGGQDSCGGDSGGPLSIDAEPDVQVGIVSYGPTGCGQDATAMGYYTSIPYFRSGLKRR